MVVLFHVSETCSIAFSLFKPPLPESLPSPPPSKPQFNHEKSRIRPFQGFWGGRAWKFAILAEDCCPLFPFGAFVGSETSEAVGLVAFDFGNLANWLAGLQGALTAWVIPHKPSFLI